MERKIICHNVGVCSMAGKVQVLTDDDAELKCPECGSEDVEQVKEEEDGPIRTGINKGIIAAIVVVLIVLAAVAIVFIPSGEGGSEPKGIDSVQAVVDIVATEAESKAEADAIAQAKADSIRKAIEDSIKGTQGKGHTPQPTPWKSYATFDGTTMTFKRSHVIPGTSKVAQPGDRVQGVWKNGEVNSVRWYHADGTPSEHLTHE